MRRNADGKRIVWRDAIGLPISLVPLHARWERRKVLGENIVAREHR
jgi:hypothetical protein